MDDPPSRKTSTLLVVLEGSREHVVRVSCGGVLTNFTVPFVAFALGLNLLAPPLSSGSPAISTLFSAIYSSSFQPH
ncbi:hypothetical protein PsorP6_007988 [Peronosclerospora sorghi]|uniref:Uncharacterized protein n=1 Tax=Peronosclerospora sorghi TaxID=230839 RepID=A0ACC0W8S2_9STRA|nr:hypothetical protein PsorP6_007988 [Peronosclerospora sorghi]